MKQIDTYEAVICVIASQIANLGESIIGAALQEKKGFQWVGSQNHSCFRYVCHRTMHLLHVFLLLFSYIFMAEI